MNVLFVGFGSIAHKHLAAWRRVRPDACFFALRLPREGQRSELPPGVVAVESWESATKLGIDSTWICSPTNHHLEAVRGAVRTGRSIFLEKPVAGRDADIEEIERLVQNSGTAFSYGCVLRHHPLIKKVKELVESHYFGVPLYYLAFCGSYLPDWRPGFDYREIYSARAALGGGVSLDLIHEFDYSEFFFGSVERIDGFKTRVGSLEIDTDDLLTVSVAHRSGVVGQIHTDYLRPVPRRDLEITFTSGVLTANLISGKLKLVKRHSDSTITEHEESHEITREALYEAQVHAFLAGAKTATVAEAAELTRTVLKLPWYRGRR